MEKHRYLFFSGKGGVGKTTMACATAVRNALGGKKTLIVTTDPASNLADVFEQEIGHKVTPINGVPNLYAMEIDPDEATREYKERIIGPFRQTFPEDVIASIEEQLNSPCTTEIASFDRFVGFMDSPEFETVVFDTAPTGHTIRLLSLSVDWSKFIDVSAKGSGQTCIGPVQAIQDSKNKYDTATAVLRDGERTLFVFVMRPEELSLYETARAARELEAIGIKSGEIIINGLYPQEACDLPFFAGKRKAQTAVVDQAVTELPSRTLRFMSLRNGDIKGVEALKSVARELFDGVKDAASRVENLQTAPFPASVPAESLWRAGKLAPRLFFFSGKGGVGKTTVSCAAALSFADRGLKTLLVTTDPAAHIGKVLDRAVGPEPVEIVKNLYAVMVDQKTAFERYKARALAEARKKYSPDMLKAMAEELDSPCTEEVAAFDEFARYMESRDYDIIVFDTAPTGHTLRMLSLPFDYARSVEMMVDAADAAAVREQGRFQKIIRRLKDKESTFFSLVFYPENTPVMEAFRAAQDLKEAGIEVQALVANFLLEEDICVNDFFRSRRAMQSLHLRRAEIMFKLPMVYFPLMASDVKGLAALRALLNKAGAANLVR